MKVFKNWRLLDWVIRLSANSDECDQSLVEINLKSGRYCYYFDHTLATKEEAKALCQQRNASLPVSNALEDDIILRFVTYRSSPGIRTYIPICIFFF